MSIYQMSIHPGCLEIVRSWIRLKNHTIPLRLSDPLYCNGFNIVFWQRFDSVNCFVLFRSKNFVRTTCFTVSFVGNVRCSKFYTALCQFWLCLLRVYYYYYFKYIAFLGCTLWHLLSLFYYLSRLFRYGYCGPSLQVFPF